MNNQENEIEQTDFCNHDFESDIVSIINNAKLDFLESIEDQLKEYQKRYIKVKNQLAKQVRFISDEIVNSQKQNSFYNNISEEIFPENNIYKSILKKQQKKNEEQNLVKIDGVNEEEQKIVYRFEEEEFSFPEEEVLFNEDDHEIQSAFEEDDHEIQSAFEEEENQIENQSKIQQINQNKSSFKTLPEGVEQIDEPFEISEDYDINPTKSKQDIIKETQKSDYQEEELDSAFDNFDDFT